MWIVFEVSGNLWRVLFGQEGQIDHPRLGEATCADLA